MRKSNIFSHNTDLQTDHLYDPLRQALAESSSPNKKIKNHIRANTQSLGKSLISKKIWDMSPEDAISIAKTIFIPQDEMLKPTGNPKLMKDKEFRIIKISEVEKTAVHEIPCPKGNTEILYETCSKEVTPIKIIQGIQGLQRSRGLSEWSGQSQGSLRGSQKLSVVSKEKNSAKKTEASLFKNHEILTQVSCEYGLNPSSILEYKRNSRQSHLRHNSVTEEKYNIFSIIDPLINRSKNVDISNEIIAKKISHAWA